MYEVNKLAQKFMLNPVLPFDESSSGTQETTYNFESYHFTQTETEHSVCTVPSVSSVNFITPNTSKQIKNARLLHSKGKYFEAVKTVESSIYTYFSSVAKLLGVAIQDETELPHIVTLLKEKKLISEEREFLILDSLLTLDGLLLQVSKGEVLHERDVDLMLETLHTLPTLSIASSLSHLCFDQTQWTQTKDEKMTILANVTYSSHYTNFSTSSNTTTQSSMTFCM